MDGQITLFYNISDPTFTIDCAVPAKFIWSDAGSGAHQDFSVYAPDIGKGDGKLYTVGHFGIRARRDGKKPKVYAVSVSSNQTENIFRRPTMACSKSLWTDFGSGADMDGALREIHCPQGEYYFLSHIFTSEKVKFGRLVASCKDWKDKRLRDKLPWCINAKYLEDDPRPVVIWNDKGSGALRDVQIHGGENNQTKELISYWGRPLKRIKPELVKYINC